MFESHYIDVNVKEMDIFRGKYRNLSFFQMLIQWIQAKEDILIPQNFVDEHLESITLPYPCSGRVNLIWEYFPLQCFFFFYQCEICIGCASISLFRYIQTAFSCDVWQCFPFRNSGIPIFATPFLSFYSRNLPGG